MKTNEKGLLYEKIDAAHIASRIKELYSISVDDHLFKMKKKITQTGDFLVPFKYNKVEKDIRVIVKAEKGGKEEAAVTENTSEATVAE